MLVQYLEDRKEKLLEHKLNLDTECNNLETKITEAHSLLDYYNGQREQADNMFTPRKSEFNNKEEQIALQERLDEYQNALDTKQKELEEYSEEISTLTNVIKEAKEQISLIQQLNDIAYINNISDMNETTDVLKLSMNEMDRLIFAANIVFMDPQRTKLILEDIIKKNK